MSDFQQIGDRIQRCRERIAKACSACGRKEQEVTLIGATKTQPSELIRFLSQSRLLCDVGENRVQEITDKYRFAPDLQWHMIGQLQSNKVKYILDKVSLIHSLDRMTLAREIQKQALKSDTTADCLIEINMGNELSKGGIHPDLLEDFVGEVGACTQIRVRGLMCVMPNLQDTKELTRLYRRFAALFERLRSQSERPESVNILSCGMSNDFELAIREGGATHVRLGRVLFGERN